MTRIDLHRSVVHTLLATNRAPRRVTRAVWEASIEREWQGVTVRTPTHTDALLILALQRGWWERGGLKPHDVVDMRFLTADDPDWRRALEARAVGLGASGGVSLFLSRCDPEAGKFALGPKRAPTLRWWRAVTPERPLIPYERFIYRMAHAPGLARDIVKVLPDLWRAFRAAGRGGPIRETLAAVEPSGTRTGGRPGRGLRLTVRGVRWAMKLWPRRDATCLVRSLALYSALRRQGWPVEFVSGVRRAEGGVTGHAWIALDGAALPELGESNLIALFRPNFRHPAPSAAAEPASATAATSPAMTSP